MVIRGEEIVLKTKVRNSEGFLSSSPDLTISIYPYGKDPRLSWVSTDDAVVLDDTPTEESIGNYVYDYTVPIDALYGDFYVLWEGTLDDGSVYSRIQKVFVSGGEEKEKILVPNSSYLLEVKDIYSIEGETLSFNIFFSSQYEPLCIDAKSIMQLLKEYISEVKIDTINYLIWQYCLEVDSISSHCKDYQKESNNFKYARKQFVTWSVIVNLLQSMSIGVSKNNMTSKRLGDLSVTYSQMQGSSLRDFANHSIKEMEKWENVLNSCGILSAGSDYGLSVAVPSLNNPDRPEFGRRVRDRDIGSPVAANKKVTRTDLGNIKSEHVFVSSRVLRKNKGGWHYE